MTAAYLDCLSYLIDSNNRQMSSGALIDPKNNDLTAYNYAYSKGVLDTLGDVADPVGILAKLEKPEVSND